MDGFSHQGFMQGNYGYYGSSQYPSYPPSPSASFDYGYSHPRSSDPRMLDNSYYWAPSPPCFDGPFAYHDQGYMPVSYMEPTLPVHPTLSTCDSYPTPPVSSPPPASYLSFLSKFEEFTHRCSRTTEQMLRNTEDLKKIEDHLSKLAEEKGIVFKDQVEEKEEEGENRVEIDDESDLESESGVSWDEVGETLSKDGGVMEVDSDLDPEDVEHDSFVEESMAILFEDFPVDPKHGDEIGESSVFCQVEEVPIPLDYPLSRDILVETPPVGSLLFSSSSSSLEAELVYPNSRLRSSYFRSLKRLFPEVPLRNLHVPEGVG